MLKIKFLVTLAAIMLLLTGNRVSAQTNKEGLSLGPSARPFASNDDHFHESELFEYDAQLWAPYDVTRVDGTTEVHSGFYTEIGVAYLSMNGPGPVPGEDPRLFESVSGWGTGIILEGGYSSEKGAGWAVNWTSLEHNHFLHDSEYRFTSAFGGWQQPIALRTSFDNVSVNRQFRQRLSNGGYVEPFVGFRYIGVQDETNQDWTFPDPILLPRVQRRFSQRTNNTMAGGHLGTRYFRTYGRYKVGSNIGVGAFYNNVTYSATSLTGNTPDGEPAFTFTNRSNDFVPVVDFGAEISYLITRDISIRAGAQLQWLWQGVARADTRPLDSNPYSLFGPDTIDLPFVPDISRIPSSVNTEDLIVAGFSFGIDWNR